MKSFPTAISLPNCTGCVVGLWNGWSSLINSRVTGQQRYLILKPLKKKKSSFRFVSWWRFIYFYCRGIFVQSVNPYHFTSGMIHRLCCQLLLCRIGLAASSKRFVLVCLVTATLHPSPHGTETKATSLDRYSILQNSSDNFYFSAHFFSWVKKRSIVSMNMLKTSR